MSDTQKTPERIGGFELGPPLGRGGMGVVYKAKQVALDRWVALKILPPEFQRQPEFSGRFKAEARAAARLDHPNLVRVWEAGEAEGRHYFAMELVEGQSAEHRVRTVGAYVERDAINIGMSVALALDYAWKEAQMIHRDIKPDNILIRKKDAAVKLADLGLAKKVTEVSEGSAFTQPGMVVGTLHYMSPEQAQGKADLDFRSDIYSLGATMYHLVAGYPPFHGDNSVGLLVKHITTPFPDLRESRDDLSDGFISILDKMVAKNPNERYASWEILIKDLEAVVKGSPPPSLDLPQWATTATKAVADPYAAAPAAPRVDPLLVGGIAAGLVVVFLLGWLIFFQPKPPPPPANGGNSSIDLTQLPAPVGDFSPADPDTQEWNDALRKGTQVSLFNGRTFAGWPDPGKGWEIKHGILRVQTDEGVQRKLERTLPLEDFEMTWQMRLLGDATAGLDFRSVKGRLYSFVLEPTLAEKKGDRARLQRWESTKNDPTTILAGPLPLKTDWHAFRLVAVGSSVLIECDGGPKLSAENAVPFGQLLRFYCSKGTAEFKEIAIRSLESSAAK